MPNRKVVVAQNVRGISMPNGDIFDAGDEIVLSQGDYLRMIPAVTRGYLIDLGVSANPPSSGVLASTSIKGPVELATDAETLTGTDPARVVTPAGLRSVLAPLIGDLGEVTTEVSGIASVLVVDNGDGTVSVTVDGGDDWGVVDNENGTADLTLDGQTVTVGHVGSELGANARLAYARTPDVLINGPVTRDSNGAATSAPLRWPDGSPGTYTATVLSTAFPGAVDAYTVTYGSPVVSTYTQPTITRDATTGAATNVPAIVVS